jgi:8-oxo-dGTP diphosphatase
MSTGADQFQWHYDQPIVGIGVMVLKDGKLLLGKRKGSHGAGEYAYPGGKLDHLESFEECAKRETEEECGLVIGNIRLIRILNFKDYAPRHFVDIALAADWISGEPEIREPDKIEGWAWYDLDDLPKPLFKAIPTALEAYRTGQVYYDA